MNWLDLGIILFAAIFVIIGIKRGFMNSVLSHFSATLNILLSFFLYRPIGLAYNKIFGLGDAITKHYATNLINKSADFGVNLLSIPKENLNSFVDSTLDSSGLSKVPRFFYDIFVNNSSLYDKLHSANIESRTLANIISESLSSFFVTIIAFVTSFIILYILILLISLLVKKLREVGFVKAVDNSLGVLYALFQCFIVLIIACLILKLMSPLSFMSSVTNYINNSLIGGLIYDPINNFIDNYLNFADIIRAIF